MGALEHLKTMCCVGLPPESAMIAVTPLLHEIIPHGWTRIGVFGEGGAPLGGWSEHPDLAKLYRERHTQLLKQPGPGPLFVRESLAVGIGWVLNAQGPGWRDTSWYGEMEAPLDSCWVLDAMIGERGRTYAALALTRPRSGRRFTPDDVRRLDAARPWLAHAFRRRSEPGGAQEHQHQLKTAGLPLLSAQLILSADGSVVYQTRNADLLLATIGMIGPRADALPTPIAKLVRRLVGAADGSLCEPPCMKIATIYGVHTIEAKWLITAGATAADVAKDPGGCLIAVSVDLHEHPVAHAARVLRVSGATPAQVNVGVKLALGKTKPDIADQLGVKPSSVADLTRKLYLTLDVHNSTELGARIWLN